MTRVSWNFQFPFFCFCFFFWLDNHNVDYYYVYCVLWILNSDLHNITVNENEYRTNCPKKYHHHTHWISMEWIIILNWNKLTKWSRFHCMCLMENDSGVVVVGFFHTCQVNHSLYIVVNMNKKKIHSINGNSRIHHHHREYERIV